MNETQNLALTALSVLLRYPDRELQRFVRSAPDLDVMEQFCPEAVDFAESLAVTDLSRAQEE